MSENNKNNDAPREQALSVAAGSVKDDDSPQTDVVVGDQPTEKPNRLWLLIAVVVVCVAVIAVAIVVPVSVTMQNKAGKSEATDPSTPVVATMAPVTAVPVTAAPVTPGPVTAAPVTPAPVTAAPSSSSERLAALTQSRLPSISFDNTMSPESRALVWMTEVDTSDQGTLSDDQLVQRFAMAAIGHSFYEIYDWLTGSTECLWGGGQVVCSPSGEVIGIYSRGGSVGGSIPVSIGLLTNIEALNFYDALLSGTIPSEVGILTALTLFDFSYAYLTGPIPSEVGRLTALTGLLLTSNLLTGAIPSEVGGLTALTELSLSDNGLTGSIPS